MNEIIVATKTILIIKKTIADAADVVLNLFVQLDRLAQQDSLVQPDPLVQLDSLVQPDSLVQLDSLAQPGPVVLAQQDSLAQPDPLVQPVPVVLALLAQPDQTVHRDL